MLGSRGLSQALTTVFFLAAPASALQVVHVVQPGAPTAIQTAVDAASDGDVVLVQAGTYGSVRVTGKALSIVADPTGSVIVSSLTIDGLAASQTCSVLGLKTTGFELPERASIRVLACTGPVLLEDVLAQPAFGTAAQAALVASSSGVTFSRCTLEGSTQQPPLQLIPDPAGQGLRCTSSNVAVYSSTIRGGPGRNTTIAFGAAFVSGPGAAGVQVSDASSIFFASGTTIAGGAGGGGSHQICFPPASPSSGNHGGPGILANGTTVLRDCVVNGGNAGIGGSCTWCPPLPQPPPGCAAPNGTPGTPIVGTATLLAIERVALESPTHVREATALPVTVRGPAGNTAFLAISTTLRWVHAPAFAGTLHYGIPTRRISLGTIPAGGVLTTSLPIPLLAPAVQFQRNYLQIFGRDSNGVVTAGTAAVLVILDQAF